MTNTKINDMIAEKKSRLVAEKKFEIGSCVYKGQTGKTLEKHDNGYEEKDGFCDGKKGGYNYRQCPMKYAFFGVVAAAGGWKDFEVKATACDPNKVESCPEYVEWAMTVDGKTEYVAGIDGGQLPGLNSGASGPCMFMVQGSTSQKLLDIFGEAYGLVREENPIEAITKYLQEKLDAPEDIRERALKMASDYSEPKTKVMFNPVTGEVA